MVSPDVGKVRLRPAEHPVSRGSLRSSKRSNSETQRVSHTSEVGKSILALWFTGKKTKAKEQSGQPELLGHLCEELGRDAAPAPQPASALPIWLGPPSCCMRSTRLSKWVFSRGTAHGTSMVVMLPYWSTDTWVSCGPDGRASTEVTLWVRRSP